MKKHYDSNYLNSTYSKLKELKDESYDLFKNCDVIVDLGCGNGVDVKNLATIYPEKKIYGLDHDAVLIEECTNRIGETHANVCFDICEADQLPLEKRSIDGVRAERLFQHLVSPPSVIKEIGRVLNKGGVLQILETDWSSINLYNTSIDLEESICNYYVNDKVKNGTICKVLIPMIYNHGFSEVKVDVYPIKIDDFKEACELIKIEAILEEMIANNKIENDIYKNIIKKYSTNFCLTINMVKFTAYLR